MFLYLQYPGWIHPQLFPGVKFLGLIRWYGLMYVFAFATAYFLLQKEAKEGALDTSTYKVNADDLFSFIATGILCLLIGARVGSTLIYDTTGMYWHKPWLIFWPFDSEMHFTGFAGMSYHGGFVGGLLGMVIWCCVKKQPVWKWIDAMAVAIPLGYTFGRLGNFLNGELFGRITTMPWGIVFPAAEKFSASYPWVQEFAEKIGMTITDSRVNLPRHPSQLYEAFFEGIALWAVLWPLRNHKKFDGQMACMYCFGYGFVRFIIEYFREPDADLGFRIAKDSSAHIYENTSLLNFSTGQILCFIMMVGAILGAIALFAWQKYKDKKQKQVK